jgi:alkylation response protein AidB-like acyl-CoA dehydrogenase
MNAVIESGSQFGAAEQEALRDAVRGLLARDWSYAAADDPAQVDKVHLQLAELGVAEFCSDASDGGLAAATSVLAELGRASCSAPVLEAVLANLVASRAAGPLPATAASVFAGVRSGRLRLAVSFDVVQAHPDETFVFADGTASGTLSHVEGADHADHLLVFRPGGHVTLIDLAGATIVATPALDVTGLFAVTLDAATAVAVELDDQAVVDLILLARFGAAARAHGAAQRAFELVVDYAKVRKQFGREIGSFQAIQHKLANCHIALEAVGRCVANVAAQYDRQSRHWRPLAAAACILAARELRRVSLETHHAFGAIGYSEEHEAPRHFRQVHLDMLRYGGLRRAGGILADHLLGDSAQGLPEYDLGAGAESYRLEVRAWLAQHWSGPRKTAHDALPFKEREFDRGFAADIGTTGWIGLTWPAEFDGLERGAFHHLALMEELERVDAPRVGAQIHATTLMLHGTPAQQAKYLPDIRLGRAMYGMGYSEPESGSDLASLKTTAVRGKNGWVINGQKIWTSTYWGRYMFVAARTDPSAERPHRGISVFIVPTDAPGLQIRPTAAMYSGTFANVFYEDVEVPDDALIGGVNSGWKVLTSALATERGLVGGTIVIRLARAFELFCDYVRHAEFAGRPLRDDSIVRERVADLAARVEAGRQLMLTCTEFIAAGLETPPGVASTCKVYAGELLEDFAETALDILGMDAALTQGSAGAVLDGRLEQVLRHSLMWVISMGTNEIQRNIIAQQGLGLPR